jgi:lysine-arginine-ornithine-binding protein
MEPKMKKTILLALTVFTLLTTCAAASDRPVRIAIEGVYPPFNYVDPQGNPKGFEVDLAKTLCDMIGRKYQFVVLDWDGMLTGLLAGKVDAVMASMSITDERKKSVAFTQKYYEEQGSFVAAKGSGLVIFPAGLKGKRIGVQRSTTWSAYVENTYPDATLIYYDNDDRGLLDLLAGRIDTYLGQTYYMKQCLKKNEFETCTIVGDRVSDNPYVGEGIGIALRKRDTQLKDQLNQALDKILNKGTYKQIADKYFDFNIYGKNN